MHLKCFPLILDEASQYDSLTACRIQSVVGELMNLIVPMQRLVPAVNPNLLNDDPVKVHSIPAVPIEFANFSTHQQVRVLASVG
jgi:hypothetical protein